MDMVSSPTDSEGNENNILPSGQGWLSIPIHLLTTISKEGSSNEKNGTHIGDYSTASAPETQVTSSNFDSKEASSNKNGAQAGESSTPSTPETKVPSSTPESKQAPSNDSIEKQDIQADKSTTIEPTQKPVDVKVPSDDSANKNDWDFSPPADDPTDAWEEVKTALLKKPEPVGIKPSWVSKNTETTDVIGGMTIDWGFLEDEEKDNPKEAWCTYDTLAYPMNDETEADKNTKGAYMVQSGDWQEDLPYGCLNDGASLRCNIAAFRSLVKKESKE